jgi:hypothetical protein
MTGLVVIERIVIGAFGVLLVIVMVMLYAALDRIATALEEINTRGGNSSR